LGTDLTQSGNNSARTINLGAPVYQYYMNFTDDGGVGNYTKNNNRSLTFDAGAGNYFYVRFNSFKFEHNTSKMYDRAGMTASDVLSDLPLASANLNTTTAPLLSPQLVSSATASPLNAWSNSYGSSSNNYILPSRSDTTNVLGGNFAPNVGVWFQIKARYMRFWFFSDGSIQDNGWNMDIAVESRTPAVPSYSIFTPQPDLIIPAVPEYIQYTPQPDLVTPQPDLVTPQPDLSTPQPDLLIDAEDAYADVDPVKINSINISATTDFLSASRLPQKLEYPYWLVYSDIIGNVEFLGKGGEQNNILAIANRAYTSGDFAFNFATDYVFKATKDFVITDITTEILNPDYSSSTIADGTIVLYKIQSPILQFNPPENQKAVRI
jgi:hypothetical protein